MLKKIRHWTMRFSLVQQMTTLVVISLIVLVAVGINGFVQIRSMNLNLQEISQKSAPSVKSLKTIQVELERVRNLQLLHLMETDADFMQVYEEDQDIRIKRIDSLLAKHANLLLTKEDSLSFNADKKAIQGFRDVNQTIRTQSKAGQKEDAKMSFLDLGMSTNRALDSVLGLHIKQSEDRMLKSELKADKSYQDSTKSSIGLTLVGFLLSGILGLLVTRSLLRRIGGEPAKVEIIANKVAEGDLSIEIHLHKEDQGSILFALKKMVTQLNSVLTQIQSSTNAVTNASEQITQSSQSLSITSSSQAASVEETSATLEEMSSMVDQTAHNASITNTNAAKAANQAEEGGHAVSDLVESMQRIAEKIDIVDEIAYQTNLLALNAAIEAARAGELGLGFAVVAKEVRKLAQHSQAAAKEISDLTIESVSKAEIAGKLLSEVVPSIKNTATLVEEITQAANEQASGIRQINHAVSGLSNNTQSNAAASEQLASTSAELREAALHLQQMTEYFKIENNIN